jgi:hypothetical protein
VQFGLHGRPRVDDLYDEASMMIRLTLIALLAALAFASPVQADVFLSIPQNSTTFTLNEWDGKVWVPIGSFDSVNHIWMPPIGGGVPPTILSATTTDLGSVPQATVSISGVNAIQSFGASAPAGTVKIVLFTAATPLVNSASLILPQGINITQTAGSNISAVSLGGGVWRVLFDSIIAAPTFNITGGAVAGNNAALEVLASTSTNAVTRLGVTTPGDAPALVFITSNAACSLNSGAGDGGSQVPTSDGKCWLASFPPTGADASEFDAVGDGTYTGSTGTDNSVALQNWLNYGIIVGNKLTLQCKTYMFRTPLAVAAIPISLHGGGSGCGGLRYFGSSTTANLITMGTVGTPTNTPTISGLRISSATMMTGGTGLILNSPNQAVLDDTSMNTQFGDYPPTLWNGIAIVNGSVKYTNFDDNGQNDVMQCYTASGATLESVDERIAGPGKIAEGNIGFHQGGGCGGVVVGANVDVIANTQNIVQDNTLNASAPNSQLFMHGVLDTPTEDNLVVNDTVQGGGQELIFDGWAASAPRYGIRIEAYPHGIVHIPSGQIIANAQDGIRLEDNTASLVIGAPLIDSNGSAGGGYGLDCTVAVNITGMSSLPFNNYAGHDINTTDCHSGGVLSSSGVSWIPGLNFASGSGWTYEANVGSYQVVGGVATMTFYIQLSALGSASGQASLTLPVTCVGNPLARGSTGALSKATGLSGLTSWPIGLSSDGVNSAIFTELNSAATASQALTAVNFTASSAIEGQLICPTY